MNSNIYSIRDIKAGSYSEPFLAKTHGEAERSFTELVRDPKTLVSKYAEDYSLVQIGSFDHNKGQIKTLDMPLHLAEAANIKQIYVQSNQ